jgi:hypothetical protein
MLRTWKKEVWDGSSPVLPGGTTTSIGATKPTRAGAPTYTIIKMRHKLDSFGELTNKVFHLPKQNSILNSSPSKHFEEKSISVAYSNALS